MSGLFACCTCVGTGRRAGHTTFMDGDVDPLMDIKSSRRKTKRTHRKSKLIATQHVSMQAAMDAGLDAPYNFPKPTNPNLLASLCPPIGTLSDGGSAQKGTDRSEQKIIRSSDASTERRFEHDELTADDGEKAIGHVEVTNVDGSVQCVNLAESASNNAANDADGKMEGVPYDDGRDVLLGDGDNSEDASHPIRANANVENKRQMGEKRMQAYDHATGEGGGNSPADLHATVATCFVGNLHGTATTCVLGSHEMRGGARLPEPVKNAERASAASNRTVRFAGDGLPSPEPAAESTKKPAEGKCSSADEVEINDRERDFSAIGLEGNISNGSARVSNTKGAECGVTAGSRREAEQEWSQMNGEQGVFASAHKSTFRTKELNAGAGRERVEDDAARTDPKFPEFGGMVPHSTEITSRTEETTTRFPQEKTEFGREVTYVSDSTQHEKKTSPCPTVTAPWRKIPGFAEVARGTEAAGFGSKTSDSSENAAFVGRSASHAAQADSRVRAHAGGDDAMMCAEGTSNAVQTVPLEERSLPPQNHITQRNGIRARCCASALEECELPSIPTQRRSAFSPDRGALSPDQGAFSPDRGALSPDPAMEEFPMLLGIDHGVADEKASVAGSLSLQNNVMRSDNTTAGVAGDSVLRQPVSQTAFAALRPKKAETAAEQITVGAVVAREAGTPPNTTSFRSKDKRKAAVAVTNTRNNVNAQAVPAHSTNLSPRTGRFDERYSVTIDTDFVENDADIEDSSCDSATSSLSEDDGIEEQVLSGTDEGSIGEHDLPEDYFVNSGGRLERESFMDHANSVLHTIVSRGRRASARVLGSVNELTQLGGRRFHDLVKIVQGENDDRSSSHAGVEQQGWPHFGPAKSIDDQRLHNADFADQARSRSRSSSSSSRHCTENALTERTLTPQTQSSTDSEHPRSPLSDNSSSTRAGSAEQEYFFGALWGAVVAPFAADDAPFECAGHGVELEGHTCYKIDDDYCGVVASQPLCPQGNLGDLFYEVHLDDIGDPFLGIAVGVTCEKMFDMPAILGDIPYVWALGYRGALDAFHAGPINIRKSKRAFNSQIWNGGTMRWTANNWRPILLRNGDVIRCQVKKPTDGMQYEVRPGHVMLGRLQMFVNGRLVIQGPNIDVPDGDSAEQALYPCFDLLGVNQLTFRTGKQCAYQPQDKVDPDERTHIPDRGKAGQRHEGLHREGKLLGVFRGVVTSPDVPRGGSSMNDGDESSSSVSSTCYSHSHSLLFRSFSYCTEVEDPICTKVDKFFGGVICRKPLLRHLLRPVRFEVRIDQFTPYGPQGGFVVGVCLSNKKVLPRVMAEDPDVWSIGYDGQAWDGARCEWKPIPWNPAGLTLGDRVCCEVDGSQLNLLVNGTLVAHGPNTVPTTEPLYPFFDCLHGARVVTFFDQT